MHCPACQFITNRAFDPTLNDYSVHYEATQHFSPRFNQFAQKLIVKIVHDYGVRQAVAMDIGCGRGAFLELLCQDAGNQGVGVDPACDPARTTKTASRLRWIQDVYRPEHCPSEIDFISCRHTLEHIQPVYDFLKCIRDSIPQQQSPVLMFEVPDIEIVLRRFRFWDIYYEHASYFCRASLVALFRRLGLPVSEAYLDFDDQYLVVFGGSNKYSQELRLETDLAGSVQRFGGSVQRVISEWRARLQQDARQGYRPVIWGAGSKGVAFLHALGVTDEVPVVVDINPYKQGKYLPGTGHEVVAPEKLADIRPEVVYVMNPIYEREIGRQLDQLGLTASTVCVDG